MNSGGFVPLALPGTIDVLIWKPKPKKRGTGGLAQKAEERPTPRFQEILDKRCWAALGTEHIVRWLMVP